MIYVTSEKWKMLLNGIKVLSFNHFLAGPAAAQFLGDLGADVIALEPLNGAFQRNWAVAGHFVAGHSVNHLATGRNKRSIAIDLKNNASRKIVDKLISNSDIVMDNFRPGAMKRLGLDPDVMLEKNPRLIYASATGFGASGPWAQKPGQDLIMQAVSGLAAHTGSAEGPPVPVGSVVIDQHAAALYTMGILAAIINLEKTGKGGRVDVSLLQAAIDLQCESITAWINGAPRKDTRGTGALASWFSPGGYGIHQTRDGHVAISMATPKKLGEALKIDSLSTIAENSSFEESRKVTEAVSDKSKELTNAQIVKMLDKAGIWNAVVDDYDGLTSNPQLEHLKTFETFPSDSGEPITFVSHPVKFNGQTPKTKLMPQELGAQTIDILIELGFTESEIEAFLEDKIIKSARKD